MLLTDTFFIEFSISDVGKLPLGCRLDETLQLLGGGFIDGKLPRREFEVNIV